MGFLTLDKNEYAKTIITIIKSLSSLDPVKKWRDYNFAKSFSIIEVFNMLN